jgi:hypothetical protein
MLLLFAACCVAACCRYIAALKGHDHVVDLLLQHCKDTGISWQAHTDGDAWTPLMAAAVGGRCGALAL